MQKLIEDIARTRTKGDHLVISVCGLGGAGKTTFSQKLARTLDGAFVSLDWYARYASVDRRQRMVSALASDDSNAIEREVNPQNWYDWKSFQLDMQRLASGEIINLTNAWDQATGMKTKNVNISPAPSQVIVIEGIYLLHDPVFELADTHVLLERNHESSRVLADRRDSHRSDETYLAFKQWLVEQYDLPYFDQFGSRAELRIDTRALDQPESNSQYLWIKIF